MKIWLVTGDLRDSASGPHAVVSELRERLEARGNEVFVIGTFQGKRPSLKRWEVAHRRILVPSVHFTIEVFSWLYKLPEEAWPNYVEVHGVWLANAWAIASFCRWRRIPYSIFVHGNLNPIALTISKYKKRLALSMGAKRFLLGAGFLLSLNDFETQSTETFFRLRFGRKPKILLTANGVNIRRPRTNCEHLLYIGRLHPIKNIETLIDSFSLLPVPRPPLIIAGSGECKYTKSLIDRVKSLNLSEEIKFVGFVDGAEKEALLRNAILLALPSFSEGQPVSIPEALSYGVPVVASDRCNVNSVENAVFICEPNAPSFAEAIVEAIRCPQDAVTRSAQDVCRVDYSWGPIIESRTRAISRLLFDKNISS